MSGDVVPERILVVGAGGQLGTDLMAELGGTGTGLTRADLDVTDGLAVRDAVGDWAHGTPAADRERLVVINAAAWTDVDGAEADEAGAHAVNGVAPGHLASAASDVGAALVHISTDYVFAGDATAPYEVASVAAPRSAYGRSKLAGELAVWSATLEAYVVRTAWVYGATGGNFVKTMARLEREREVLSVVDDQRGSPTWSRHLGRGLVALARTGHYGTYHLTNGGETTWCGFARAVFEELGADPERVQPCATADFPRPAPRPAYSVLSDRAWRAVGLDPLPPWRDALAEAFAEIGSQLRG
ncbi:MAG TPA: dTDP-4-dehydrorhamnose reductase [Mycobacteriales bacterium]|nr:dTDP-4-dehydrorhamnose reductase [Mycobacteriales bacterium]